MAKDKARASPGRPPTALPDRAWAEEQLRQLARLAIFYDEMGDRANAASIRARRARFAAAMPKRFRAGKPWTEYVARERTTVTLDGREVVVEVGALNGLAAERRRAALRDAHGATLALLKVLRTVASLKAKVLHLATRVIPRPRRRDAEQATQARHAAHLSRLRVMAEGACERARTLWRGTETGKPFREALAVLAAVDAGREPWPTELRKSHRSRAIIVVSEATGASVETIRRLLARSRRSAPSE
jgi:hypothetical protein